LPESCTLEHYSVKNLFNEFLEKYTDDITKSHTMIPLLKTEGVSGTTYSEFIDGEWRETELDKYTTVFVAKNEDIKNVDFVSIRTEFYRKCLMKAAEIDKQIFKTLEPTKQEFSVPYDENGIIEFYFQLLRAPKEKAENSILVTSPSTYDRMMSVLTKPENQEKIRREIEKINNERKR
jgi:hypothetical protein